MGTASGEGCNCLIYSLIAAAGDYFPFLGIAETVRELLMVEFRAPGDAQVTESNFLDYRLHTPVSLRHFSRFPCMGTADTIQPEIFTVSCVEEATSLVVDVVGNAPTALFILNQHDVHAVPLLRQSGG